LLHISEDSRTVPFCRLAPCSVTARRARGAAREVPRALNLCLLQTIQKNTLETALQVLCVFNTAVHLTKLFVELLLFTVFAITFGSQVIWQYKMDLFPVAVRGALNYFVWQYKGSRGFLSHFFESLF
jgi:hypothetical protein